MNNMVIWRGEQKDYPLQGHPNKWLKHGFLTRSLKRPWAPVSLRSPAVLSAWRDHQQQQEYEKEEKCANQQRTQNTD